MDKDFKKLQKYFEKAKSNHINFQGECHDCGKEVIITVDLENNGKLRIKGGSIYFPDIIPIDENQVQEFFIKCDSCFKEDSILRNYQPALQYSRTVGYLRLVSSWNKGKAEEFKMRKEYKIPKEKLLKVA